MHDCLPKDYYHQAVLDHNMNGMETLKAFLEIGQKSS